MFRVLGSPYTVALHQHVTYLRLQRLPFKVYCHTFTTTLLYAFLFRARCAFCTVDPRGYSYLQLWQLVDAVEGPSGVESLHQLTSSRRWKGSVSLRPSRSHHPRLHLVNWIVVLYSSWWLAKTGAMYRWFAGDSVDIIDGYIRYFFIIPGVGISRAITGPFRQAMQKLTSASGVSVETAPYMQEHFEHLCSSLDTHFKQLEEGAAEEKEEGRTQYRLFLLGTPHPTLADVALGAVFSANFLMDDPPASSIVQNYPYLNKYLEKVTGWRGGVFVEDGSTTESPNYTAEGVSSAYPDVVPESLSNVVQLIEEVMPFMLSQCTAFHAHMAGDGVRQLRKEPLEGPWKGCSGYLLPQVTDIKSLMIIDNGIYTICARAQDLEVALLAAREVVDDEADDDKNEPVDHVRKDSEDEVTTVGVKPTATKSISPLPTSSDTSSDMIRKKNERDIAPVQPICPANIVKDVSGEDLLADDADFHRVFTAAGGRAHRALQLRRAAGKLAHPTMDARLARLRGMLRKMHHPHYTLSTVFHGRKLFVAVIPEHEVEGRRERERKDR